MALNFGNGFNITAKEAVDTRIIKTKAEMKALSILAERRMPDIYFCLCPDDKKFYIFDVNATASEETGKFRPIEDFINFTSEEAKANLDVALVDSITNSADVKEAVKNAVDSINVDGGLILDIDESDDIDGGLITD